MDDTLETPSSVLPKVPLGDVAPEENDQSSEDEEGGLDWTKLLPAASRPVIPKRGEKEFEPRAGGGSNLQLHVLDRARNAMFETLRATRTTSTKVISYAIWRPEISRADVTLHRGIHFSSMGHSAPRTVIGLNGTEKVQKRLELLPEEAIYLIERGSLFCWKEMDMRTLEGQGLEEVLGAPMSVEQAFAEMIGRDGLTLEKFQVFAYLRRLGYVVTRADPPNPFYPTPPPRTLTRAPVPSIIQRIRSLFSLWTLWTTWISRAISGPFNWWKPISVSRWFYHDKNYGSLFRSLRFMPSGHDIPLQKPNQLAAETKKASSPYKIFYNIYKPNTSFKKTAPGQPDFQVVVINARTTPMPSLQELTDLFDVLPEVPLPLPRQRRPVSEVSTAPAASTTSAPVEESTPATNPSTKSSTAASSIPASTAPNTQPEATAYPSSSRIQRPYRPFNPNYSQVSPPNFFQKHFPWAFPPPNAPPRRPNPFMALKAGKKIIVIAVVDAGSISFFRFGQGAFMEWPMMGLE